MQDKLFQDAFANAEVTPPAAAWDGITSSMAQKKKRRAFIYFSAAASILIGLFAITFITLSSQNKSKSTKLVQEPKVKNEKPKNNQSQGVINTSEQKATINEPDVQVNEGSEKETIVENNIQNKQVKSSRENSNTSVLTTNKTNSTKKAGLQNNSQITRFNKSSKNSVETSERIAFVNNELINNNNSTIEYLNKKAVLFEENTQSKLDLKPQKENVEWVNTRKNLNLIFGLYYSPIFTKNNLVNSNDIAFNQTIVQDNLVNQEIKNYTVAYGYSQQFGFQIGKKLTEKLDILAGIEYSNWMGTTDLYLKNNYETKVVLSQQISDEQTIREINEKVNNGSITVDKDLTSLLQGSGSAIVGFESFESGNITNNTPVSTQLTGSDSTTRYEQISITRNSTYDDTVTTKFTYTYYEIPLIVRYKLGNKRLKGVISGGFSTVFGRKTELQSVAISQYNRSVETTNTKASFQQWNALLNVGFQYQINSKWAINVMPFAKWNLNGVNNKSSNGKGYMGIQFGAEINL